MSHFATVCVHAGGEPDPRTGAVVPPISLATTFAQAEIGSLNGRDDLNSLGKGYEYSRTGNPTRGAFERAIAACEQAKHAIAYSSGMAATSAIINTLNAGDNVICIDDVYGGTQRYFRRVVNPNTAITFTFLDLTNPDVLNDAITPTTKLVWIETPTNPTLKVADIRAIAAITKAKGVLLAVDNTFFTPALQNPIVLGADFVVHSVTKYIGGHSDVVMGVIATNSEELYTKLKFIQNGVGAVPSPFDCYLALRGLRTLHLRIEACSRNAMAVATYLESQMGHSVDRVIYPGLASHPQHDIVKKQAKGFGGMITFFIKGGLPQANVFLSSLKFFTLAESLGACESLAESPAIMTHASVPADKRAELGISDNLVRLSIGIEHVDDLLEDVKAALKKAMNEDGVNIV